MSVTYFVPPLSPPSSIPLTHAMVPPALLQPSFSIIVPARAHWFSAAAVHPIERTALPEFFPDADADASLSSMAVDLSSSSSSSSSSLSSSSSQPSEAAYTRHRNRIIDAYRAQPHVYLTATACRRMLVGDAFALLRLHAFLESWGLINYQARRVCGRCAGNHGHPMRARILLDHDASSHSHE